MAEVWLPFDLAQSNSWDSGSRSRITKCYKARYTKPVRKSPVGKRLPVRLCNYASSGRNDRVAGGNVPFVGRCQSWVQINMTLSHSAEFQG